MVYVRVELWPGGDRTKARLLQEATIANVGGTGEFGNYAVKVSHSTTYKGNGFADPIRPALAEVWKSGGIAGHARKLSPFHLVCKAVGAAIGVTMPTPADGSTVERKRRGEPAAVNPVNPVNPTGAIDDAPATRVQEQSGPQGSQGSPTPTPLAANEPRCRYCGKPGDSHVATIFENRERRAYRFCSPTCATHYQMGAEG